MDESSLYGNPRQAQGPGEERPAADQFAPAQPTPRPPYVRFLANDRYLSDYATGLELELLRNRGV